ncbi:MAG: hypothetical protein PHQ94_00570 [Syntrophomonas sp.]|nr:hypothetical protein [Syntrophomonas sp.]
MDTSSHESLPHSAGDKPAKRKVPRSLFVIIIICLAGLYGYAAYGDKPAPEKTVQNFYQAYFNRDFDTVAQNLSVFWSVRLLPEYASKTPAELIQDRTQIEAEVSKVISEIEKENTLPEDISVDVMKEYTKIGQNSALVVYSFKQKGEVTSMEAALLILEKGQFRIFNMSPVNQSTLEQVKGLDINVLDESFAALLAAPQAE